MPALYRPPALRRILAVLVVPIRAKRFYRHYSGQPALLNRHYRGIPTVRGVFLFIGLRIWFVGQYVRPWTGTSSPRWRHVGQMFCLLHE